MENKGKEEELEQQQTTNKKSTLIKTIKIVWKVIEKIIILAVIIISIIIVTQKVTDNEKAFLGYRIFKVETGSMIPKYNIGDVILVKEKDINEITIGEDVTYWGTSGSMKGKIVTHQVIDIETVEGKKVFHTKGIANKLEDPVISGNQISGVVKGKMYILTGIISLLTNKYIFYFGAIIPLTIFIFVSFVKVNLKRFEE